MQSIINKLHEVGFSFDGIILNAAGYTHTSVGIGDAKILHEADYIFRDFTEISTDFLKEIKKK